MIPDVLPLSMLTSRLARAASRAELITAAQGIQHLSEHWQREHAGRIVKRRLQEFKKR